MHLQPLGAFAADVRSPGAARDAARARLDGVDEDVVGEVVLALSELATNAVLHARSAFSVRLGVDGGTLRVEVDDDDPTMPRPGEPQPYDVTGRGLLLVEAVADCWGVDARPAGKTVWFERALVPVTDGLTWPGSPAGRSGGRP